MSQSTFSPTTWRGKVLVIEPDELVGRTINRLLRDEHHVAVERDAPTAVARIVAGESFDVVLCELLMPKLSGIQVYLALLQADRALAERLVFITGAPLSDETELFLQTSRALLLEKPFSVSHLRAVVSGFAH
jgi:CheY-like chemotaxis protein